MTPESNKLYEEESRALSRSRGKIACLLGITFVPLFLGLDYIVAPELASRFAFLRSLNTVENVLIFLVLHFVNLPLRRQNFLIVFYFCSIGMMIAYMCYLMGGFTSPYYSGICLVMLVIGVFMPWNWAYTLLCGLVMYGFYFWVCLKSSFDFAQMVNSNYFLISTIIVCLLGSIWKERERFKEFQLRQRLKEMDQAKSQFFANVSHELKTPVTLVLVPVETLLDQSETLPHAAKGALETIRQNALRLSDMIGDLLDLTRSEVGKAKLCPAPVEDAEGYFRGLFDSAVMLMRDKGIEFVFEKNREDL